MTVNNIGLMPGQMDDEGISPAPDGAGVRRQSDSSAFQSQLDSLLYSNARQVQNPPLYGQTSFDMSAMAGSLPHSGPAAAGYGYPDGHVIPQNPAFYQMQHAQQFQGGRGMQPDPAVAARFQQQQFQQQFNAQSQNPMMPRTQLQFQPQTQYSTYEPYLYNVNQFPVSPVDPRIPPHNAFSMPPGPGGEFSHYTRRSSEPAGPIPSFPRGPPRKPKQSGHALWVGNLPPAASITDLKDHFSRDATNDIESLFLISKSNCAFVNYRSEAACVAAMNRFHDSRFHGVRLVCRLRRGAATGLGSSPLGTDLAETPYISEGPAHQSSPAVVQQPISPTIVNTPQATSNAEAQPADGFGQSTKEPEKYFIVKSLTVQDLEASVQNGIWATQSHNEDSLNKAYEAADNVYLIFSANKSGEYFGYARMASKISGEPVNLSSTFSQVETRSPGVPQSIPTPATETAPRGRIIDDSARGTIFWEAEHSDDNDEGSPVKDSSEASDGQNWGRQFSIEWKSTSKLPFYRTRGLRNPWNANREVKIARDGTEIEPSVGRRLIQMFHRPSPSPGASQVGAPFR